MSPAALDLRASHSRIGDRLTALLMRVYHFGGWKTILGEKTYTRLMLR